MALFTEMIVPQELGTLHLLAARNFYNDHFIDHHFYRVFCFLCEDFILAKKHTTPAGASEHSKKQSVLGSMYVRKVSIGRGFK